MPWWVVVGYIVGAFVMFRFSYLGFKEKAERKIDKCNRYHEFGEMSRKGCENPAAHLSFAWFATISVSAAWPLIAAIFLLRKLMFPRGAVTTYAKQKAVAQRQAAKEKELEKLATDIKKASKTAGLKIPEGL